MHENSSQGSAAAADMKCHFLRSFSNCSLGSNRLCFICPEQIRRGEFPVAKRRRYKNDYILQSEADLLGKNTLLHNRKIKCHTSTAATNDYFHY